MINFLPIPLLDGGHMALLIYEGIRGKPADERVQEGSITWIGLIFILALTIFVFGLDLGWIPGPEHAEALELALVVVAELRRLLFEDLEVAVRCAGLVDQVAELLAAIFLGLYRLVH